MILAFATILIVAVGVFTYTDSKVNTVNDDIKINAFQQHVYAKENGVDPTIGVRKLPKDFIVDGNFESHLPLVVIDIDNQEIKKTKVFERKENGDQIIVKTTEDPFVEGQIEVINNDDYCNHISDEPESSSKMKIRLRGSSSQNFDKKQYAIKMLDDQGNASDVDVLGMGENNDWILNISMLDGSLTRNYAAFQFGSALFPGTPDCRYCEVVTKKGENQYEYLGVYLMMEKIEKGKDRVDISTYKQGDKLVSYLLCRDRENENDIQLSTYGNEEKALYGRLSVLYPQEDIIDDYAIDYIEKDIDTIERVLYSDDLEVFNTWQEYLDKQSFVDYYLFNSIFRNYDAGNNSTYMYKNAGGKLCMGPVWDYDNACNNDYNAIQIPDYNYFYNRPWFERLVLSENYVNSLEARYKELTSGIFSAQYIEQYLDDIEWFLGNAAERDWQRWGNHYGENSTYSESYGLVDSQGFVVDRRTNSVSDEILRFKKYFYLEEEYMEENIRDLRKNVFKEDLYIGGYYAVLFGVVFVCAVILIGRRKMYK